MDYEKAQKIYNHLLKTNQGFCFLESTGEVVSREDCEKIFQSFWKSDELPF